jgi:hypothetical protein
MIIITCFQVITTKPDESHKFSRDLIKSIY